MFESDLAGPYLDWSAAPEKSRVLVEIIRELLRVYHKVEPFNRSRDHAYGCLDETIVIVDIIALRKKVEDFVHEAGRFGVLSFDLEGPSHCFPAAILLQILGGGSVIIHLWKILQLATEEEVVDALAPFFGILASNRTLILGSNLDRDFQEVAKWFGFDEDMEWTNVCELSLMFRTALAAQIYHPSLVEVVWSGGADGQTLRSGLGWVSLVENGFNHKCFDKKSFKKLGGSDKQWQKFDPDRKIMGPRIPMYQWQQDLTQKQLLYAHIDITTPLRVLLALCAQVLIEDPSHFGIEEDENLGNVVWKVVLPMYMDLQVPPKSEVIFEFTEEALDDAKTLAKQWFAAYERKVLMPEVEVKVPGGIVGVRTRDEKPDGEQSPLREREVCFVSRSPVRLLTTTGKTGPEGVCEEWPELAEACKSSTSPVVFNSPPLQEEDLEKAFALRRSCEAAPCPLAEQFCDQIASLRFLDPTFKYKVKKYDREFQRSKRKRSIKAPTERLQDCNHRRINPVISRTKCHHCAVDHVPLAEACPIFRYHKYMTLHYEHFKVMSSFPCLHCDSTSHVTAACKVLHSFCKRCGKRGHLQFPHPSSLEVQFFDAKFDTYAPFGLRTQKAKGEEGHRWGFKPSTLHTCNRHSTFLSDTEDDSDDE